MGKTLGKHFDSFRATFQSDFGDTDTTDLRCLEAYLNLKAGKFGISCNGLFADFEKACG